MPLLQRLPKQEIADNFTHKGLFAGFLPVYVNLGMEPPMFQERNWWPEPLFYAAICLYASFIEFVSFCSEDYEPAWPVTITGEIRKEGTAT